VTSPTDKIIVRRLSTKVGYAIAIGEHRFAPMTANSPGGPVDESCHVNLVDRRYKSPFLTELRRLRAEHPDWTLLQCGTEALKLLRERAKR